MSFDIRPNFDIPALSRQAEMFPKSGAAALNRVAKESRTLIANKVSEHYNIKRTEAFDKMTVIPATQSNLVARIRSKSRGMTVMRFDARESGLAGGVVLDIVRDNYKVIRNAFVNIVPTGGYKGKLVLARTTNKRYPLEAIRTISITTMIMTKRMAQTLAEFTTTRLPEELTRLIKLWGK